MTLHGLARWHGERHADQTLTASERAHHHHAQNVVLRAITALNVAFTHSHTLASSLAHFEDVTGEEVPDLVAEEDMPF